MASRAADFIYGPVTVSLSNRVGHGMPWCDSIERKEYTPTAMESTAADPLTLKVCAPPGPGIVRRLLLITSLLLQDVVATFFVISVSTEC